MTYIIRLDDVEAYIIRSSGDSMRDDVELADKGLYHDVDER